MEVPLKTHLIDLSVESHSLATGGHEYVQKEMSVCEGVLEFNPDCMNPQQGNFGTLAEARKRLLSQKTILLNGSTLDFLLAHPEFIPDVVKSNFSPSPCFCDRFCECKPPTHRRLFFLGTIYQSKTRHIQDLQFVRFLHNIGDGWCEGKCRLEERMHDDFVATYEDWSQSTSHLHEGERLMIALDVAYTRDHAYGVAVGFRNWSDHKPLFIEHVRDAIADDYTPGEFWKRELPVLQKLVQQTRLYSGKRIYLVDGYVWLDAQGHRGLGAVFWEDVLLQKNVVIGIAKTAYRDAPHMEVRRGDSDKPLFVTAAGIETSIAAQTVRNMHGSFRLPTLIKLADTCTKDLAVGRSDSLRY